MSQSYDVLALAEIRHLSTLDDTGGCYLSMRFRTKRRRA